MRSFQLFEANLHRLHEEQQAKSAAVKKFIQSEYDRLVHLENERHQNVLRVHEYNKLKQDAEIRAEREKIEQEARRKEVEELRLLEETKRLEQLDRQQKEKEKEEQLRLEAEKQSQQLQQDVKNNIIETIVSTDSSTSSIPYVVNALNLIQNYEKIVDDSSQLSFSSTIKNKIQLYVESLNSIESSSLMSSKHVQLILTNARNKSNTSAMMNTTQITHEETLIQICALIKDIIKTITYIIKEESSVIRKFIISLFALFLTRIEKYPLSIDTSSSNSTTTTHMYGEDDIILLYSTIIQGIFRELSPNLSNQLSKLFQGQLYQKSILLIPDTTQFSLHSKHIQTNTTTTNDNIFVHFRYIKLQASLCISNNNNNNTTGMMNQENSQLSPYNVEHTWKWLQCIQYELQLFLSKSIESQKIDCNLWQSLHIPYIVCLYIQYAGYAILLEYSSRFMDFLKELSKTIQDVLIYVQKQSDLMTILNISSSSSNEMNTTSNNDINHIIINNKDISWKIVKLYIDDIITKQYIPSKSYQQKEPHVIHGYFIKYQYEDIRQLSLTIDEADRRAGQNIRFQVGKAFNRLDVTIESAQLVVDSLLEYIGTVGSDDAMLGYTLNKMASLLIDRTRTINITVEGHTAKLARVASILCNRQPQLKDLLKSQFYYICPLIFPHIPEVYHISYDSDLYYSEFNYLKKIKKDDQQSSSSTCSSNNTSNGGGSNNEVWETDEEWLDRMGRIIAVFADIINQTEYNTPFSIHDGWKWLAHIVNMGCQTKLPEYQVFFMAEILDIFLRITATTMIKYYGNQFIKILKVIQKHILPNVYDYSSQKLKNSIERLATFLNSALQKPTPVFLPMITVKT